MPDDFALGLKFTAKDNLSVFFDRSIRNTDRFGDAASRNFNRANMSASRYGDTLKTKVGDITQGIIGARVIEESFDRVRQGLFGVITESAKLERAETQFGTFLKSAEKGVETVDDLRRLGADTPFRFEDFEKASTMMLGMRATTRNQLIPDLTMLGDTAGGSADRLSRIAYAYSETQANSKASFQEIRQFTNAGVPMLATLADMWGVTTGKAKDMVKQGKATGAEIRKAFEMMTSEGGMFYQGMKRVSQNLLGLWSTFLDEIVITQQTIGTGLLPTMKEFTREGIQVAKAVAQWSEANKDLIRDEVVEWLKTGKDIVTDLWPVIKGVFTVVSDMLPVIRELSPILPVLAAGWLANKTAMSAMGLFAFYKDMKLLIVATKSATVAQWAWNIAQMANPVGAVIMGLTLLAGGIALLVYHWDTLTETATRGLDWMLTKSKEVFFGILRIFTWTIGGMAKLAFKFISGFGEVLGMKTVEREFASLVDLMDELDEKMKEHAGQNRKWRLDAMGDAMEALRQRGDIRLDVPTITLTPKDYKIESVSDMVANLQKESAELNIRTVFPKLPQLTFDRFKAPGLTASQDQTSGGFNQPFIPPDKGGFSKVVVQNHLKVDIPGAPEGTKVSITKSNGGGGAPQLSLNLSGAS